MTNEFNFEEFFDEDYLYFTLPGFTTEFNDRDVEIIWQLLELEPGMRILDLGCGYGRIANRLALRGCQVIGIDMSAIFLDMAREEAKTLGLDVMYIQGDMRTLPWTDRFDRIVSWFSTFGYFSDQENRKVLTEAWHALRPGGRLLIDHMNRDGLLHTLPRDTVQERDGNLAIHHHDYNPLSGYLLAERIVVRNGQIHRSPYMVRLFTFPELRHWLLEVGFSSVNGFGPDSQPFSLQSAQMDVIAHK